MPNILVVNFGALVTSWLSQILRREGFEVEIVAHEKQATRVYDEQRHHLIVADLRLPYGLEMIEELLRRNHRVRILTIVGAELIHPDSVLNVASVFGSVCILRKPFTVETFLKTVAAQLSEGENRSD